MSKGARRALLLGSLAGMALVGYLRRRSSRVRQRRNRALSVAVVGDGPQARSLAVHCARVGLRSTLLIPKACLSRGRWARLGFTELFTGITRSARVFVTSRVGPEPDYDLAVVCPDLLGPAAALELARQLAQGCPVLVQMEGPSAAADVERELDQPSVLLGSLGWTAFETSKAIRALPAWLARPMLGESQGGPSQRLSEAMAVLRQAGLTVDASEQISPWLWSHAGMLAALASSAERQGGLRRLAASSEGFASYLAQLRDLCLVLEANGLPTSAALRARAALRPVSLSAWLLRLFLMSPCAELLLARYLAANQAELDTTMSAVRAMALRVDLALPALDSLSPAWIPVQ